jgi:SAM-dependent methyltransferase
VTTFGAAYAQAYDLLYEEKDYAAEVDLLERVFKAHAAEPVRRVLDLGCGTGRHTEQLIRRGYEVVGVDASEAMLEAARARLPGATFVHADIKTVSLEAEFDAALLMFAVLGYQTSNADVLDALWRARRLLRPGGLLFFDVWYGPAVLAQRPTDRVRVQSVGGGERVLRTATPALDTRAHACTVEYHVWRLSGDRVLEEASEQHRMRFFFPLELELLLESGGFDLLRLGAFPDLDEEPSESTWNVAVVARALP